MLRPSPNKAMHVKDKLRYEAGGQQRFSGDGRSWHVFYISTERYQAQDVRLLLTAYIPVDHKHCEIKILVQLTSRDSGNSVHIQTVVKH